MRIPVVLIFGFVVLSLLGWGHRGPRVKVGFVGKDPSGHSVFLNKLRGSLDEENADLVVMGPGEGPKDLLEKGALALVVYGAGMGKGALAEARAKGIPILSVERPLEEGQDFLVAYDPEKEGELQARAILQGSPKGNFVLIGPKVSTWFSKAFRDGQRKALQTAVTGGDIRVRTPQEHPTKASAWLAFDLEDTREMRAEKEKMGLKGLLGGVGEDLDTCRAIQDGRQTMTVYRSPLKLAEETAYLASKAARKAKTFDCQFVELPFGNSTVRTVFLTPQKVEAKDLEGTVIKDGVWTREEIFGNK